MKGGMAGLMKQAQQMQTRMKEAQEEIAKLEVIGQSGGGMVKVTINGRHDCRSVEIDPTLLEDDKEMLEDLIAAAINDASHKIEQQSQEKMSGLTAGMPLPPGMKMPF